MDTLSQTHLALTPREALSGIFGSISLLSWILVLAPQLLQNYLSGSADSISLAFLCIWFAGDVANLSGALWARLVPTVTALAIYFCFADAVLISQCVYYRIQGRRMRRAREGAAGGRRDDGADVGRRESEVIQEDGEEEEEEDQPLLSRRTSAASNLGLPGSHRHRSSTSSYKTLTRRDSLLVKILEDQEHNPIHTSSPSSSPTTTSSTFLKNTASILGICVVGTAGWAIAYKVGAWSPAPVVGAGGETGEEHHTPIGAEILGYLSAIAYLGARIPQIVKNWRERSCEGLSLLFFLLSLLGNLTYGAGILFHSTDRQYVMTNLPWLIGSLGTMVEDVTIFAQFHIYGEKGAEQEEEQGGLGRGDDVAVV